MRLKPSLLAALASVVLVTVGCVTQKEFKEHKQELQDWLGPPTSLPGASAYANLREWQVRVTDVVCRLEQLDDADDRHVDNIPQRLCATGAGDPTGAPPPPPDLLGP